MNRPRRSAQRPDNPGAIGFSALESSEEERVKKGNNNLLHYVVLQIQVVYVLVKPYERKVAKFPTAPKRKLKVSTKSKAKVVSKASGT